MTRLGTDSLDCMARDSRAPYASRPVRGAGACPPSPIPLTYPAARPRVWCMIVCSV
ncbi:hypothetical protein BC628DRAFT_353101 [Trametes gibbosa]|nr:hypothetical protein BC628DRAFT_353101 [Trametes gibbosa]